MASICLISCLSIASSIINDPLCLGIISILFRSLRRMVRIRIGINSIEISRMYVYGLLADVTAL